ncbi:glucosaminidase domain-containing protein [Mesonia sp. K4-1]|uniref:glucosaminidase domain-containing protein n=1 Tax=Mesonia sp. K4-1 TaxID=2602760 RepID=UPI0011CADF47|nr:glucosaminidase domain-containing protein [Mesonia sp. K4-1]TXK75623.1 LysM peptidoglycan-binding domain-containing protein [Mesonia sp. K4-1]
MKGKILILLLSAGLIVSSCGSKKNVVKSNKDKREKVIITNENSNYNHNENDKAVTPNSNTTPVDSSEKTKENTVPVFEDNNERYIYNYAQIAKDEMSLYGIPASITIAQGILESSAGRGELTLKSNNHFGIKCNGWEGEKVYHDDDTYQECFRKYKDPKYSFRDHSLFLKDRRRYSSLFNLKKDDYKGWAYGLKKAGYATDPRYPAKLISIIERYQLQRFDDEVLGNGSREGNPSKETKVDYTSIRYTVKKGDTLYSISQRYNLTVEELKSINKLKSDGLSIGQKLYVKTL